MEKKPQNRDSKADLIEAANRNVDAMEELTTTVKELPKEVAEQRRFGRHNRLFIWISALFLVVDIGLTAFTLNLYDRVQHQSDQAQVTCLAINTSKAQNKALWFKLKSLSPPPPPGTQAATNYNEFITFLHHDFTPLDCSKAG